MAKLYMVETNTVRVIDELGPDGKGIYGKETPEELALAKGITIELIDSDALLARTRVEARLPISEITRDRWWDAFECMVPIDYARTGDAESFFMAEVYTADVHWGYVKVGERYFEFRDQVSLKHDKRVRLAREFIEANPTTALVAEVA